MPTSHFRQDQVAPTIIYIRDADKSARLTPTMIGFRSVGLKAPVSRSTGNVYYDYEF